MREFDDVFRISANAPFADRIEVIWDIEPGYYLYNNRFLKFESSTEGVVLGEPQLPAGEIKYDELLGEEVEKFHQQLRVSLPLLAVPPGAGEVALRVRSQGCLENELCYPPSEQRLTVRLPAAASGPLDGLVNDPLEGLGVQDSGGGALDPEDAFVYEVIGLDSGTALARFTAQPGYYLYRDKFEFRVAQGDGFEVASVELPEGVIKDDPEFGEVPVYFGQIEVPVRLNRPAGDRIEIVLQADFQGCRDGDICYPPMSRSIAFEMPASATAEIAARPVANTTAGAPVSEQDRLARLLTDRPASAVLAFFVAGLLLAFTPCVFPMVPILSGIIAGQGSSLTTRRAFWLSLVYVLAMAVTYTVAGVLAGLFGQNLQAVFQNPWIISAFVAIFIALAFSMFGFYELQLPSQLADSAWLRRSNRLQGAASSAGWR